MSKTKTKEKFVEEAKDIHGDKYIYDKVVYKNTDTPVIIICPIHGNFPQRPYKHLQGQGCPWCAGNKKKTIEEFIEEARVAHGNRYRYDNVVYINNKTPVIITCPEHGDFPQTPHDHKSGKGCPKCKTSHMENTVSKIFDNSHIKYEYESHINNILKLKSVDFYLTEYNMVIECQGGQHFYDSFGDSDETRMKTHQSILKRDIEKHDILLKNNIRILYYTTKDICPKDIFSNEKYNGIYTQDNLIIENKELLLSKIKGEL